MKTLPWIIVILVIAVLFYIVNQNTKAKTALTGTASPYLPTNPNGYALGLTLANLLSNTKCGKDGDPPCTIKDLQDAGWSPEQIASAEAGSQTVQATWLCINAGIGC